MFKKTGLQAARERLDGPKEQSIDGKDHPEAHSTIGRYGEWRLKGVLDERQKAFLYRERVKGFAPHSTDSFRTWLNTEEDTDCEVVRPGERKKSRFAKEAFPSSSIPRKHSTDFCTLSPIEQARGEQQLAMDFSSCLPGCHVTSPMTYSLFAQPFYCIAWKQPTASIK